MGKHIIPDRAHAKGDGHAEGEAEAEEDKAGTSQVDITQLLEKYGKLQNNPLLLMEDGKKLYQREGFRIRSEQITHFHTTGKPVIIDP
jgi:hypothetical protein